MHHMLHNWYTEADLEGWERFFRANVLSSLSGPKPGMLVGTIGTNGQTNAAVFQNVVHLGANPALIGLINRPEAATPHTLANIRATQCFTLNAIPAAMAAAAHGTSAKYETSEWQALDLEVVYHPGMAAPFWAQSPVRAGLRLVEIVPVAHNGTFLIIGQVQCFYLAPGLLQPDGFVNLAAAEVCTTLGLDAYASLGQVQRFGYARPHQSVQPLPSQAV